MAKRGHSPHFDQTVSKKTYKGQQENRNPKDETTLIDNSNGELGKYLTDERMIARLKDNGIQSLFPIQQDTFHLIDKGRDITAKDRTGSGKTLAYTLPSLHRLFKEKLMTGDNPKILVMVPTRELALQVANCVSIVTVSEWKLRTLAVYGGDGMARQMDQLKRGVDVVVATPGRLVDFINRGVINFKDLKILILDEADEMLKQGFKEEIEKIFRKVTDQAHRKPQTLLFSATIPQWLDSISRDYQTDCEIIDRVRNTNLEIPTTIKHYKYFIRGPDEVAQTVRKLCNEMASLDGRVIIFCETKRQTSQLYEELKGEKCKMLHGDVKQWERERIYNDFKTGRILKIVATSVIARGVDFPDVELVIQVEPPRNVEQYIHRAGRTGRAGKEGVSVLLFQKKTSSRVRDIESEGKFQFKEMFEFKFQEKNAQKKYDNRYDNRRETRHDDRYENRRNNRHDYAV